MSAKEVTIARIYTLEGHGQLNQALDILRDEEKIVGATIIRGIAGYGENKGVHTSSLLTLCNYSDPTPTLPLSGEGVVNTYNAITGIAVDY